MSDIAVIGASPAGIAVAIRLAVKHHDVTVVDAAARAGGLLVGHEHAGLVFDTGAVTLPAVFRDLFLKTGGSLEEVVNLQPVEIAREHRLPDGTSVCLPGAGVGLATRAIGDAFGEPAREQWAAFMAAAADEWAASRQEAWHAKSTEAIIAGTRTAATRVTRRDAYASAVRRQLRDARLRVIATDYAASLGFEAARVPAALMARPYVEQAFGIWHVGGGRRRLADALVARAEQRGVRFRLGAGVVSERAIANDRRELTLSDGSTLAIDAVVPAAASASLYAQSFTDDPAVVPPHRPRWGDARPARRRFLVLAAVEGLRPDAHLTTWHSPDPARIPTITVCAPDDPAMREAGAAGLHPWTIAVPHPGRPLADEHSRRDYADHVLAELAARGTDIRPRLRAVMFAG